MTRSLGEWTLALDGSALPDSSLVGGKAWSVARMSRLGLPVPPAIVITTRACAHFIETGSWPDSLAGELETGITWLEGETGRTFGRGPQPLLLSVRSGAPVSMPGMMDTVLNLGISEHTRSALADESGDEAFARDTHRRFLEMFCDIVLKGVMDPLDPDAAPAQWIEAVERAAGASLPSDVHGQLNSAITAVFESWNTRRAKRYRKHHDIPDSLGTAVTVQAMVFGNLDAESGTGVLFSRNPLSGDPEPFGEYLARAQGEDVVSGKHTPQPLSTLRAALGPVYEELLKAAAVLEKENGDVQDIEFTVERGKLYLLQSRAAKRSPAAAARIAVDMVAEGTLSASAALRRVSPEQAQSLLSPVLEASVADAATALASGEGASPGVGSGVMVSDSDEAERRAAAGESVILVRETTSPDDIHGMLAAAGIATESGGSTSHAAVVSRALGKPSVVGCGKGSLVSQAGSLATVDGAAGKVFSGVLPAVAPEEAEDPVLCKLLEWARAHSPIDVQDSRTPYTGDHEFHDLDKSEDIDDPSKVPVVIRSLSGPCAIHYSGTLSQDAIEAALESGVTAIYTNPVLPTLLAVVRAGGNADHD